MAMAGDMWILTGRLRLCRRSSRLGVTLVWRLPLVTGLDYKKEGTDRQLSELSTVLKCGGIRLGREFRADLD